MIGVRVRQRKLQIGIWTLAAVLLLLFLMDHYRSDLAQVTDDAQWIWISDEIDEPTPSVGLFSAQLDLSQPPLDAVIKVAGDQQLVVWVNGLPAVVSDTHDPVTLEVVPITALLRQGSNVFLLEVRSPTSVGGTLFSLDLRTSEAAQRAGDPDGRGVLVSGPDWRSHERWQEGMPSQIEAGSGGEPFVWGRPPMHPWTSPRPRAHARPLAQLLGPAESIEMRERVGAGMIEVLTSPAEKTRSGMISGSFGETSIVIAPEQTRWLLPAMIEGSVEIEGIEGLAGLRWRPSS